MTTNSAHTVHHTSSVKPLRRAVIAVVIGSFSIASLIGIVALLTGGEAFPDWRILTTTMIVGCASVSMLCYLAVADTRARLLGTIGGAVALLPTAMSLFLTWGDEDLFIEVGEGFWKTYAISIVIAFAIAHACLLIAGASGFRRVRPVLLATLALIALLASLIVGSILVEDGNVVFYGVVAILDVLGSVVTVALTFVAAGPRRDSRVAGPVAGPDTDGLLLSPDVLARLQQSATAQGRSVAELIEESLAGR